MSSSPGVRPLLELRHISKCFGAGMPGCSARVQALRDVSVRLGAGELLLVSGGMAAGKTTLLLCAARLLRPDTGYVRWGGRRAACYDPGAVGFVPAAPVFSRWLTVEDALAYHAPPVVAGESILSRDALLDMLELEPLRCSLLSALSAPQLRRIALGCALARGPRVLLVDEPPSDASDPLLLALANAHVRKGGAVVLASRAPHKQRQIGCRELRLSAGVSRAGAARGLKDGDPARGATTAGRGVRLRVAEDRSSRHGSERS